MEDKRNAILEAEYHILAMDNANYSDSLRTQPPNPHAQLLMMRILIRLDPVPMYQIPIMEVKRISNVFEILDGQPIISLIC